MATLDLRFNHLKYTIITYLYVSLYKIPFKCIIVKIIAASIVEATGVSCTKIPRCTELSDDDVSHLWIRETGMRAQDGKY